MTGPQPTPGGGEPDAAPPAGQGGQNDVASIFQEALTKGQKFAGAQGERPTETQWVHDQTDIVGKQVGAADVHREVADKLRAAGNEDLADAIDEYADYGDQLTAVYSGEGTFEELPAINAEMDATQERIEDLAGESGVDEQAVDDLLGI